MSVGFFERNDVKIRRLEGLEEGKGWFNTPLLPNPGAVTTEIVENSIEYTVDVENGQKTGFFLTKNITVRLSLKLLRANMS